MPPPFLTLLPPSHSHSRRNLASQPIIPNQLIAWHGTLHQNNNISMPPSPPFHHDGCDSDDDEDMFVDSHSHQSASPTTTGMSDTTPPPTPFQSTHEQQQQHPTMERRLGSFSAGSEALGGFVFPSTSDTAERDIREVDGDDDDGHMDTSEDCVATARVAGAREGEEDEHKPMKPPLGERFSKDEENRLITESTSYRISGNRLFNSNFLLPALDAYKLALTSCPIYLVHEVATIYANIAAVELKLQRYPAAVKAATKALEGRPRWGKALYRRARGREGIGGWAELEGALEDYRAVEASAGGAGGAAAGGIGEKELEIVREKIRWLPGRIEEVKDTETAEVMGKLKQMGEGLLKPFGINTSDFGMVKGADGAYSLQFRRS
ncbi:unnamed protein product [Tuber melanosporum]|uniref:(Perigord truffle) hypothetical protein n=1 Tax=Tuber melanosporum (strain Mel28) TaxID=656061 RepID=D5GMP3_TUBMM|nr:uncharacterized protein GSTUM_00010864001 [Tuber melanosporum]CAZ85786.1 unnamed protein product [Tuber melanosporum]